MRRSHLIISVLLVLLLVFLNRLLTPANMPSYGGLTWLGWASVALVIFAMAVMVLLTDSARAFGFFRARDKAASVLPPVRTLTPEEIAELGKKRYRGPEYPHPVIFPERCIGCQACVDACPHDVLAIVDGRAKSIAPDQCMEDTACQAECPVNPKACIVVNTAKEVRSLPTPKRDGATYQTNVPGCFIIGDVSGVPLIKNAVKEGAEVVTFIAGELKQLPPEPKAEFDLVIIGVGPGGASASATAHDAGLKFIGIEQDKILATIAAYPKGKYIFFKPDTKDWFGGIPVAGLGLAKAKYGASDAGDDSEAIASELGPEFDATLAAQSKLLAAEIEKSIPPSMRPELAELLAEKTKKELKKRVAKFLWTKGASGWANLYQKHLAPDAENLFAGFRAEVVDQLNTKIPGDQRESILAVWMSSLSDRGIKIREGESCKAVTRAEDGDYFTIETVRNSDESTQRYTARRVVISIGLRGAPNRLRLPNEDMKAVIHGREQQKVQYSLSNPAEYTGRNIVVVGGGNAAVEAAVDLVAKRSGSAITPRTPEEMNRVTLLVRDYLAPTVKFGNKFQLYQCADSGILDLRFGIAIKEMREHELLLADVATGREVGTIPNDHVFALIGGERPDRFLKSIGITIE
jgi:thioredoxin reductase